MPSSLVSTSRVAHPFITTVSPGYPPEFKLPDLRPPTHAAMLLNVPRESPGTGPPSVSFPRKQTIRTPAQLAVVGQPS
ncbi:hypothetical protein CORC01_08903 [Colletotrichum orchidophilum]|uniref:Uncharacterized protein n=1 Tax=Colletotrichum orchidophilum TaxID=1209926 RepID=A0A1G4B393_9PEZI|nr:uncharacterized protein CORC01_08903 [Colletotrichum orchidophilum]OHE95762.1 hypothetical protein CORC01_08903 [Colletotrichum orchidophilum]